MINNACALSFSKLSYFYYHYWLLRPSPLQNGHKWRRCWPVWSPPLPWERHSKQKTFHQVKIKLNYYTFNNLSFVNVLLNNNIISKQYRKVSVLIEEHNKRTGRSRPASEKIPTRGHAQEGEMFVDPNYRTALRTNLPWHGPHLWILCSTLRMGSRVESSSK